MVTLTPAGHPLRSLRSASPPIHGRDGPPSTHLDSGFRRNDVEMRGNDGGSAGMIGARASPCDLASLVRVPLRFAKGELENLIQEELRSVFGGVGEDVVGGVDFY